MANVELLKEKIKESGMSISFFDRKNGRWQGNIL